MKSFSCTMHLIRCRSKCAIQNWIFVHMNSRTAILLICLLHFEQINISSTHWLNSLQLRTKTILLQCLHFKCVYTFDQQINFDWHTLCIVLLNFTTHCPFMSLKYRGELSIYISSAIIKMQFQTELLAVQIFVFRFAHRLNY